MKKILSGREKWGWILLVIVGWWLVTVPVTDADLGWHLMTGKYVWQMKAIPRVDVFSYSLPGHSWVVHSWFYDVILWGMYSLGGMWGVATFLEWLVVGAVGVMYLIARELVRDKWVALLVLIMVPAMMEFVGLRNHGVTLLGLTVVSWLFVRNQESNKKEKSWNAWLRESGYWILLPTFWLWANMHAGVVMGWGWYGMWIVTEMMVCWWKEKRVKWWEVKRKLGVGVVLMGVSLVNPYGVNIVRFAQSLAASQASKLYNQDWLPLLSSRLPRETIGLRWGLVLMVLLVVMAVKEKWRERILVLASLGMALLSVRYSLLVLVGLLPMIPVVVEEMLDKVRWVAKEKRRGWLVLGILTVLVGGNMDGVKRGMCAAGSNECLAREGSFPLGAVEYLKKMGGELEIVNHYTWGGYLMWQLPRAKVFIDGRMDNFEVDGRAWIEVFADIESMRPGWEKWLEMKGGNVVLIPSDWSLGKVLVDSGEWGVGYEDKISVVLVKNEVVDD